MKSGFFLLVFILLALKTEACSDQKCLDSIINTGSRNFELKAKDGMLDGVFSFSKLKVLFLLDEYYHYTISFEGYRSVEFKDMKKGLNLRFSLINKDTLNDRKFIEILGDSIELVELNIFEYNEVIINAIISTRKFNLYGTDYYRFSFDTIVNSNIKFLSFNFFKYAKYNTKDHFIHCSPLAFRNMLLFALDGLDSNMLNCCNFNLKFKFDFCVEDDNILLFKEVIDSLRTKFNHCNIAMEWGIIETEFINKPSSYKYAITLDISRNNWDTNSNDKPTQIRYHNRGLKIKSKNFRKYKRIVRRMNRKTSY